MQLAAQVFAFGEPGATGRLLGEWVVWGIGLSALVACAPRRYLQIDPLTHVALVALSVAIVVLGSFLHATSYFHRIDVTREGDLAIGYDEPKLREQLLPSRRIEAIEVGAMRMEGASTLCRLIVVSDGWKHSSVEDECRSVERARTVLSSEIARREP